MGYTLKRINGIYHARWHFPDEKPCQRTTHQRLRPRAVIEADRIYAAAEAEWKGRRPTPTLRELAEVWLKEHKDLSQHYRRSVETFQRRHLYDLGDLSIRALDSKVVKAAFDEHSKGRTYDSAMAWYRILTALVLWAVGEKMLEAKPWKLKLAKVQKQPHQTLPKAKVRMWFEAVDRASAGHPHVGLAVRLWYGLGLRHMEAFTARWEWVDWERRLYTPGQTKNRKAQSLKIPRWLLAYLLPLRKARGLIMPGKDGRPHAYGYCRKAMEAANTKCETPGITPHRLRGSLATHLSGLLPLQTLQNRMRHDDPKTTLIYTEREDQLVDDAQEKLAQEIGLSA